jgi:DNA-binding GntR family transcriptional regulator
MRDGRLNRKDPLPSARKMADLYGVASMTAQRALRELQNLRIIYSLAGKGTFVHPTPSTCNAARTCKNRSLILSRVAGLPLTSPTAGSSTT